MAIRIARPLDWNRALPLSISIAIGDKGFILFFHEI